MAGAGGPLALTWDPDRSAQGLAFPTPQTVLVTASDNQWHAALTQQQLETGRWLVELSVDNDSRTTNSWKIVFGVVPPSFDARQRSATCVGSPQGGYGYVCGTGNRYSKRAINEAKAYGPTYTTGDVIGMELDFDARSIRWFKNQRALPVAFDDLRGPVFVAVSLTAHQACVTLRRLAPLNAPAPARALEETDARLVELEAQFQPRLHSSQFRLDLAHPFWDAPLASLLGMGFTRVASVEALLATMDDMGSRLSVNAAVEHLTLPPDEQRRRLDAAARRVPRPQQLAAQRFEAVVAAGGASAEELRRLLATANARLADAQRQMEEERKQAAREVYREALVLVLADRIVHREERVLLQRLLARKGLQQADHVAALQELGVSLAEYDKLCAAADEAERAAAAAATAPRTSSATQEGSECALCLENRNDHVILDCMHLVLCGACAEARYGDRTARHECPTCRKPIREIRRVFF